MNQMKWSIHVWSRLKLYRKCWSYNNQEKQSDAWTQAQSPNLLPTTLPSLAHHHIYGNITQAGGGSWQETMQTPFTCSLMPLFSQARLMVLHAESFLIKYLLNNSDWKHNSSAPPNPPPCIVYRMGTRGPEACPGICNPSSSVLNLSNLSPTHEMTWVLFIK